MDVEIWVWPFLNRMRWHRNRPHASFCNIQSIFAIFELAQWDLGRRSKAQASFCKYWSFHVARAQSMDEDEDMDQKLELYVSVGIDWSPYGPRPVIVFP